MLGMMRRLPYSKDQKVGTPSSSNPKASETANIALFILCPCSQYRQPIALPISGPGFQSYKYQAWTFEPESSSGEPSGFDSMAEPKRVLLS